MRSPATTPRRGLPPAAAAVSVPADRRFRRVGPGGERRRRGPRGWLRLVRWGGAIALAGAAAGWGVQSALASSLLTVQHLVVRGHARLSAGEVVALVSGLRGQNILQADLEASRARLLDSPWVADAALSRVLPSTIHIDIVERVPMAVARAGTQVYLIDRTGTVIDEFTSEYRGFDLPIVDGLLSAETPDVDAGSVALAGRLLTALAARPDLLPLVSQADVADPHDARVMLGTKPAWLHLGDERFAERLQTYLDLEPALEERFPQVDYVDLRFDERVYVRQVDGARTAVTRGHRNRTAE